MTIAVFGSSGFIGRAVVSELELAGYKVLTGINPGNSERIDLLDKQAIVEYLGHYSPEVVINCAGLVGADVEYDNNTRFTENILAGVKLAGVAVKRVIITGSAGEYGQVSKVPVSEDAPLNATNAYALSKVREELVALRVGKEMNVQVVVARVFNPLGPGMQQKFLIPKLLDQINDVQTGKADRIEISRLDSRRDYIAVSDIAVAYRLLIEGEPKHAVYNIGSGIASTNAEIVDLLLKNSKLSERPKIIETSDLPESLIACQADISRIHDEFGWKPVKNLELIVKEIVDESK